MRKIFPFLALPLAACGTAGSEDPSCEGAKCDAFGDAESAELRACETDADFETADGSLSCSPCMDVLADESGRGFLPQFVANDALFQKVYMTFVDADQSGRIEDSEIDCPLDLPSIMAKLEQTDNQNCRGLLTHVVSETAALVGKDQANYRAVTSRDCDNRGPSGLLFSTFGFTGSDNGSETGADQSGSPGQVEVIAFDETEGIFNYYKEVGGQMRFFGSSLDFVAAGPGGPELTSKRGCANCHPGGGIVMKELESPWTHWAQNDNIVGANELVQNRSDYLGTLSSGAGLEPIIEQGNREWNATKVDFFRNIASDELENLRGRFADSPMSASEERDLEARGLRRNLNATQELLRPLFCTVQINIQGSGTFSLPQVLFADPQSGPPFISISDTIFNEQIAAMGSEVPGTGAQETTTAFIVPHRSGEDQDYVNVLTSEGIVSPEFVRAVRMVDFTRVVFSDERCGLLDLIPDVDPGDRNAAGIQAAVIDGLQGAQPGTPEAELLANLQDPSAAQQAATSYASACSARDPAELTRDALKLRSLQRKLMFGDGVLDDADGPASHRFSVFEFAQTMPADNVRISESASPSSDLDVHPDARFSPSDCTLTGEFVPVSSVAN